MPHYIRTEAARVAMAEKEGRELLEETDHKLRARARAIRASVQARGGTREEFMAEIETDKEMQALALRRMLEEVWWKTNISDGCIPFYDDEGRLRWCAPEFVPPKEKN